MLSRSSQQNSTKLNEVRLRQGFGATAFALYLRCERRLEARLLTTLAATPTRPLGLLHLQTTPPAAWQQHRHWRSRYSRRVEGDSDWKAGDTNRHLYSGHFNMNEGGTIKPRYINSNSQLGTQAPASARRFKKEIKPTAFGVGC